MSSVDAFAFTVQSTTGSRGELEEREQNGLVTNIM